MDESELIKRCLKKEKRAWDIFIQRYSKVVCWAIRKRLSMSDFAFHEDDVNDIFQEVFLSIIEGDKLLQIKNAKLVAGWLAMVASNKAVDFMRKRIRSKECLIQEGSILKDDVFREELHNRDLMEIIKSILDTLSVKEKIVISLNLLEDRTHREIASIVGLSINTVSTLIARAKQKLRERLEKRGIKNI